MTEQQQPAPPTNATEARTVLDGKIADKSLGDRVFNSDAEATKEMNDLTTMIANGGSDVVEMSIASVVHGDVPDSGQKLAAESATWMRERGLSDGVIRQVLTDHEVTPEEFRAVEAYKAQKMASKEFTARYLAGEPDALREMLLANVVLSATVKKSAAA